MEAKRQLTIVLLCLLFLIILGAIGYKYFGSEERSWIDAFYHTILTIASIGYTDSGFGSTQIQKFYGIIFMTICLVALAITAAAFVSFFVQSKINRAVWEVIMTIKMTFKREHHVIFGVNHVAPHIINEFYKTKTPFCVVTHTEGTLTELSSKYKGLIIFHYTKRYFTDEIFEKVKVRNAITAIIDLGNDEKNHITADLIREKNPKIKILSVNEEPSYSPIMQKRINHVVNPHFMCAMRLASLAKRPSVVTHLDRMLYKKDGIYRVEEVKIKRNSSLVGKTLGEVDFPKRLKLIVTEIMRPIDGGYDSNFLPLPEDTIIENMIIIVQGEVENVEILRDLADGHININELKNEETLC